MDAALPVVEPMALVHDRYAVHVGVLDPAKASTVRENVREWRKAQAFCLSVSGKPWPEHFGVILDDLHLHGTKSVWNLVPALCQQLF